MAKNDRILLDQLIFDERANIRVFLAVLEICKAVENAMFRSGFAVPGYSRQNYATLYRFLYTSLYLAQISQKAALFRR